MWFDKENPDVVFGDIRHETLSVVDRSHGKPDGRRILRVAPDAVIDFRDLPYASGTFHLVVMDPPHLTRVGPRSWLGAKYGRLGRTWQDDLRAGISECLRVLRPHGVLIFKWNETHVPLSAILELAPYPPLFGHTSRARTHWLAFMRPLAPRRGRG